MTIHCLCVNGLKRYGYFISNNGVLEPITYEEAEGISQERLLNIEVCPRCGNVTGVISMELMKEYTASPYLLPEALKKSRASDASNIRRLPGTTLQAEELPLIKINI